MIHTSTPGPDTRPTGWDGPDGAAAEAGGDGGPRGLSDEGVVSLIERMTGGPIGLNTVYEILKNRRRRRVLRYLLDHGGQSTVSDLAEHVGAIENGKDASLLSSQERKRVYIGLYQCHLPRMHDSGVIEFDRHRGTVEIRPETRLLQPYLRQDGPAEAVRSTDSRLFSMAVGVGAIGYLAAVLAPFLPAWLGTTVLFGLMFVIAGLAIRL